MSKKQKTDNRPSASPSAAATAVGPQKKTSEKKPSKALSIFSKALPYFYGVLFALAAWLILSVGNKDYLFEVQNRSLWTDTGAFFAERMLPSVCAARRFLARNHASTEIFSGKRSGFSSDSMDRSMSRVFQ